MPILPKIYTATADENGNAVLHIDDPGLYQVNASIDDGINTTISDTVFVDIQDNRTTQSISLTFARLVISTIEGALIEATNGTDSFSYTATANTKTVFVNLGTWTISGKLDDTEFFSRTVDITAYQDYAVTIKIPTIYTYRVKKNNSAPTTRVTYLDNAVGKKKASISISTGEFSYGGWADAWFITGNRPVALKYDGTEDYELNHTDFTKKLDGTASDVTNSNYGGNFMAAIPTCWVKRWEDNTYRYVSIADIQVDSDYHADAHTNANGTVKEYAYAPMFKGVYLSNKCRSLKNMTPSRSQTSSTEKTYCEANGPGWSMWYWSLHELISDLCTLISGSTNSQVAFGYGYTYRSSSSPRTTGDTGNAQFYGRIDYYYHVTVSFIEDFWGNRWDRCLGLNVSASGYMYKMTPPYSLDGDSSYTTLPIATYPIPTSGGYQTQQYFGEFGILPKTCGGTNTTYECDFSYFDLSGSKLACFGGYWGSEMSAGSRFIALDQSSSVSASESWCHLATSIKLIDTL